ncbi:MAG: hypothetical protein MJZ71_01975 [Bacteroidales bacterium]|nr:hypothetical protein [Bacteroidales bacterium]
MKKYLLLSIMSLLTLNLFAQKDVTTFLGIPVDGTKNEMKQKLITKGFSLEKFKNDEAFTGEFNGTDVNIYITTNNNKVYRIMVCDANTRNEADIKIRFNKLVNQFQNNKRYIALEDYTLSDSEDISYEMSVHNKVYEAIFYQLPDMAKVDTLAMQEQARNELLKKYTEEQLQNPTEEIIAEAQEIAVNLGADIFFKKPVWFRICELYGKYYIAIYYDNEYNHANGEDL